MRASIADSEQLLPPSVVRSISDKLYDKRKVAALEVEQLIKKLAAQGDTRRIGAIIDKLVHDFAFAAQVGIDRSKLAQSLNCIAQ